MQTNLQIIRRKAIQINDSGTLSYVTYVIVIGIQNYFFQNVQFVAYKLDL